MRKIIKYVGLFIIAVCLGACNKEEALTPSGEELFPPHKQTELDKKLAEMYRDYNTVIEYKYIKNLLPSDWYYITPVAIEKVLPMAIFLKDMWVTPLEVGSSKEFVQATFPRNIVFVGSPALQKDGTRVLGQAEGGTLIRFTEVNDYSEKNRKWMQLQLETAYHEYCHILHQTFTLPDAFRKVTPNAYTKNGWRAVKKRQALSRGMVSPYGTSAVEEDFVEIYAHYITKTDKELDYLFNQQEPEPEATDAEKAENIELNKGRALLTTKLGIVKKFTENNGMNMDKIRQDLQEKLNTPRTN